MNEDSMKELERLRKQISQQEKMASRIGRTGKQALCRGGRGD